MPHGDKLPPAVARAIAAKAKEALGLLALVKPLFARAGGLTEKEQDMLTQAVKNAGEVLGEARQLMYRTLYPPKEEVSNATAVRREGNGRA